MGVVYLATGIRQVAPEQPQDPASKDAGELVAAILRRHAFGVRWVEAQRHRVLPSELPTRDRPWSVEVIVVPMRDARRGPLLDTYAMRSRSCARGCREQPSR